jgi:hypothetical protein
VGFFGLGGSSPALEVVLVPKALELFCGVVFHAFFFAIPYLFLGLFLLNETTLALLPASFETALIDVFISLKEATFVVEKALVEFADILKAAVFEIQFSLAKSYPLSKASLESEPRMVDGAFFEDSVSPSPFKSGLLVDVSKMPTALCLPIEKGPRI